MPEPVAIDAQSRRLLGTLLAEQPRLATILRAAASPAAAQAELRAWADEALAASSAALRYARGEACGPQALDALTWRDLAAIRLRDYLDHEGHIFEDLNLDGQLVVSAPVRTLWLAATRGTGGGGADFFADALELFRQLGGQRPRMLPERAQVERWMARYPSGLDPAVVARTAANQARIIDQLVTLMDRGELRHSRYVFAPGLGRADKIAQVERWWGDHMFHLRFAARSPRHLDALLDGSLPPETLTVLRAAEASGLPFFVNPYYLSLLHPRPLPGAAGADLTLRDYVIYSPELVEVFGEIRAWEREDQVVPGEPNAAGWLLPAGHNVHRRYPEVAILVPDSMSRACGGLCACCQRMFDFQRGRLHFELDALRPKQRWEQRLEALMGYWERDTQLRDILITGGDALMSSDRTLERILEAVFRCAAAKRQANLGRAPGRKHAELQRVRLGTRLPVYLPQRITPELAGILARFRERSAEVGIRQFVIQTHFASPLEVTPDAARAVARLQGAGWIVTNQHVLTAAAARRGHAARLRQVLGQVGVLPYYTFSCKGYRENTRLFVPHARLVQEQIEEKVQGQVSAELGDAVRALQDDPPAAPGHLTALLDRTDLPFLATDRSVLNLPGVGKSLTFRTVGITVDGRRVLAFDHDSTRRHSPVVDHMGKVMVVESKSVAAYLRQLEAMGEDPAEVGEVYGYSLAETEPRQPIYEYPDPADEVTDELNHLALEGDAP